MFLNEIVIPYQNHSNKKLFDYALTCCNQLNNINCATDSTCIESKENNYIYLVLNSYTVFLFIRLSRKNKNCYDYLTDIWIPLDDVEIPQEISHNLLYKFNIKKFHSLLSFASNYKDRNNIKLIFDTNYSSLYYAITDTTMRVDLAKIVNEDSYLYEQIIRQSLVSLENKLAAIKNEENKSSLCYLDVTNVDKNSFLLPYFNHKTCLNFSVASSDNRTSVIITEDNKQYIINTLFNDENNLQFYSKTALREDKFNFNLCDNVKAISPGLWQLLTILQSSKVWQSLYCFNNNICKLNFTDDISVYHMFNSYSELVDFSVIDFSNYETVGELVSNEVFLLNKLFVNSKNSYFDFSKQKFIGTNYVFGEDPNEIQETDLVHKQTSLLPLKLTFTELKNYIGSDLSQKDFILIIKTDGINIMIEKWNKDKTQLECNVVFNHAMSKKYLNI